MTEKDAALLLQFLDGTDIPCPGCAYNLRGLTGSRCPECGEEVVLQVGMSDPKAVAAILGTIGLAARAGLNGLLVIYALIRISLFNDSFGGLSRFFAILGVGLVIEGGALLIWLRSWRRIRRLSPTRKSWLVIGCFALTLLDLLFFSCTIK